MRTLAIGDIHGSFTALTTLLEAVHPSHNDRVIFLGDYIDVGWESKAVLDCFISEPSLKSTIFVRGNHEVMMLEARHDPLKYDVWQGYGGLAHLSGRRFRQFLAGNRERPNSRGPAVRNNLNGDSVAAMARAPGELIATEMLAISSQYLRLFKEFRVFSDSIHENDSVVHCRVAGPGGNSPNVPETASIAHGPILHVIAADTGEIVYADKLRIMPSIRPAAVPASVIRETQEWTDKDGHAWQEIHLHPFTRDCQLFLTLRFCSDLLFSAEFYANIRAQGFSWRDWTVTKEHERKKYHDRLLSRWLGSKTKFPWGKVWSTCDTKGGFSTFGITYQTNACAALANH